MTSLRQFRAEDLLRTSLPNLDPLTENYDLSFYNQYLAVWPELFTVAEDIEGNIIGYSKLRLIAFLEPTVQALHQNPFFNLLFRN